MGALLDPEERHRRKLQRDRDRRDEDRRADLEANLDAFFADQQTRILRGFAEQTERALERRWAGLGWSGRDQLTEFEHRK